MWAGGTGCNMAFFWWEWGYYGFDYAGIAKEQWTMSWSE